MPSIRNPVVACAPVSGSTSGPATRRLRALLGDLANASKALLKGDTKSASNQLKEFTADVAKPPVTQLDASKRLELVATATRIRAVLGYT